MGGGATGGPSSRASGIATKLLPGGGKGGGGAKNTEARFEFKGEGQTFQDEGI